MSSSTISLKKTERWWSWLFTDPPAPPPPPTEANLFEAVERGDEELLCRAVNAGFSINARRCDGVTPLILATAQRKAPLVRLALKLGADPQIATDENLTAMDFARGVGDIEIEDLLLAAVRRQAGVAAAASSPIASGVSRDLDNFLDEADLVLPPGALEWLRNTMASSLGQEEADRRIADLEASKFRVLFEQLFAPESLAVAHLAHPFRAVRSPMCIGMYDVPLAQRRGLDICELFKAKFEITDALLWRLLPDEIFIRRPQAICEIGGAWGATIDHLTRRFQPDDYYNYEPDRHFAEWAANRYGVKRMPVDGETLQGTPSDSVDLAIANNVLIFVPPIKVWSYLVEMRRVIRKHGIILFNAVISDQIDEEGLRRYTQTFFPKRAIHVLPRDFIDRTFPAPDFELLQIADKEYFILRRTA